MKGCQMLIREIIEGLSRKQWTSSDVKNKIESSNIDPFYKKGLESLLFKDGKTCIVKSDTIWKLFNLELEGHKRVALFEKVSRKQYIMDNLSHGLFVEKDNGFKDDSYNSIELPKRGTKGSAGYDFISPVDITLNPGEELVVCSGIRCQMEENWVLKVYPRSSSGTEYRIQFNNTVPILDSDYYYTDNEGHIMFKIINDSREGKTFELKKGEKLCQGIFVEYGITFDDDVTTSRTGGFGSTGK